MDKNELLGTIADDTQGIQPDFEAMKTLHEDSAVAGFCTNCGNQFELGYTDAENIFLHCKEPLDFDGKYIEVASCAVCKGTNKNVSIKKIQ